MLQGKIAEFSVTTLKNKAHIAVQSFIASLGGDLFSEQDKKALIAFIEREQRRRGGKPKKMTTMWVFCK